jgi:DNA-binding LacI/PurR family transcriptional regulator
MTPAAGKPRLSESDILRVAVQAQVQPATVRAWIGETRTMRPSTVAAIEAAARKLHLWTPPTKRKKPRGEQLTLIPGGK